jgi:hypothetical protein
MLRWLIVKTCGELDPLMAEMVMTSPRASPPCRAESGHHGLMAAFLASVVVHAGRQAAALDCG